MENSGNFPDTLSELKGVYDEIDLGENYTRPNDDEHIDTPEDWLFGSLLFARTLGLVLGSNQGVVVDLNGDMVSLHPSSNRVIVFNDGHLISVINADERTDLKEGDYVQVIKEENIQN